jgi:hypothetical protein
MPASERESVTKARGGRGSTNGAGKVGPDHVGGVENV